MFQFLDKEAKMAIKTDNLINSSGSLSVPIDTVVQGSAKAWTNFNGTGTVAIRVAFNVSSITDNGVGNYTVNFVTPITDANYSACGMCNAPDSEVVVEASIRTSTAFQVTTIKPGVAPHDVSFISVIIFR